MIMVIVLVTCEFERLADCFLFIIIKSTIISMMAVMVMMMLEVMAVMVMVLVLVVMMVMVLVTCEYERLRDGFRFKPGSSFSTVGAEYYE